MSQPSSESVQAAVDNLLDALVYDGAHHKQKSVEKALSHLVSPEEFQMLKDQYEWEEG